MIYIVLVALIIIGIVCYYVHPRFFFLYYLGVQPYALPVIFLLWGDSMLPMDENFLPRLYFRYQDILSGLMLLLFCLFYVTNNKHSRLKSVILNPLLLIVSFLIVQNILVGFSVRALYTNIINVLWNIAPFLLLFINKAVRPNRGSLIRFIKTFIIIQSLFVLLNIMGYRIYGDFAGNLDDKLICGTFTRYNHMANYLATFYFILSYDYYEYKRHKLKSFLFFSVLIGLLIFLSGSKMTLILFVFSMLFFFLSYHGKKVGSLVLIGIVTFFSANILGNDYFSVQTKNVETGYERNLDGIINLSNSDDLTEGNTLSMSAYVLVTKFNSPLIGNGMAYRPEHFYGHPSDTYNNEAIFRTDARLAFMLVDYGIVGLFLFFLLFAYLYKGCRLCSDENKRVLYIGAFIYFLLFSVTDNGFWDYVQFSVLFIYVFSIKKKNEIEQVKLVKCIN